MYQQPISTLQNSTPKRAGENFESVSQEAIYHGTLARTSLRYQVFEKLLWKPSEDASQKLSWNQMSLSINISKSSDSFSTVPLIINGGDWRCIVRDLETVLVLLEFNFIPQRSYHQLTKPKSRIRDSETVTLTPGNAQKPSKWSNRNNRSVYCSQRKKSPWCRGGTITGLNYGHSALDPDTVLTS